MADAYAWATYCSECEGLEFPILANLKYGWGPGQKRSVDIGASISFSEPCTKGTDEEPFMIRTIYVRIGFILATASYQTKRNGSNISLTLHNCSE